MINLFTHPKNIIPLMVLGGILLTSIPTSYSQTTKTLVPKVNIPTSPEAALLGRFGDIPIGYYTGTANISIPLYSIKEGEVEIPITLNYHSSGVKVEDQATWVGLGWDLTPEGTIIQEVRGVRDELDMLVYSDKYNDFKNRIIYAGPIGVNRNAPQIGFASYNPCLSYACCGCFPPGDPTTDDAGQIIERLKLGHGQPDIYHYNFNGYAGKFYINPETKLPILIDKKTQIYFEKLGINFITATTLDGCVYYFNVIETAYESGLYELGTKAGKTFKLSSIHFLNGKNIDFAYRDAHFTEYLQNSEYTTINDISETFPTYEKPNLKQSDIKILSRITTSDAIINFNLDKREDMVPNTDTAKDLRKLKSIDIISKLTNKKIKTFVFYYSYFPYNFTGVPYTTGSYSPLVQNNEGALGKRLKLDSIRESGYNYYQTEIAKPAYKFEYDLSNTLPLKISKAKDFWGYYNGYDNGILLPDLDYFEYPESYKGVTNNSPFTYPYKGSNRYTDNSKAGTYLLKKITYPTGGFTEFEYAPNTFSNQFIPDNDYLKKSHKDTIVECTSISRDNYVNIQFKLGSKTKIHFENRINNGNYNYNRLPALTKAQMKGCSIQFYKYSDTGGPHTTLIKQWDLDAVLTANFETAGYQVWSEDLVVDYDPDPSPYFCYHIAVSFPLIDNIPIVGNNHNINYASTAGVSCHFGFYDKTGIETATSVQCGMRVKSIKNYSQKGSITSNKLIKYYGGKLLNHFQPIEILNNCWLFQCVATSNYGTCPQLITHGAFNKLLISSDGLIKEGGNLIGYDSVAEIELASNNVDNNGKKIFSYYNFENITDMGFPVQTNPLNGLLKQEKIYNSSNQLLQEKNYNYQNLNSTINCYYGITLNTHFSGSDPNTAASAFMHKYSYNAYPLLSEWNKLLGIATKQYFNGKAVTTSETYTYNQEGNPRTITTISSKKDNLVTKNYYPLDGMIHPYIDNYMTMVHNTGTPVITEQYKGTEFLSRKKIWYGAVASAPTLMPQYIDMKNGNMTEERRVIINSYDAVGNITQYTEGDGIYTSYLYGYNKTYPISEVKNATLAECDYTGFENHEAPGWQTFSSWSIVDEAINSITGRSAVKVIGGGPAKYFTVGISANNHSGYKASIWVKGGNDAYLHMQVNDDWSLSKRVTNLNSVPGGWNLMEVSLPYNFYKNSISSSMQIKVYCGSSGTAYFDDLRFLPCDAHMTTYSYDHLVGVTSVSDVNNKPTKYEYDGLGRVILVRDYLDNIRKKYAYHYKP